MADSFIQHYTPTAGVTLGAKMDSETLTVGANTVERERIQVTGATALEVARVIATTPAGTEMGLVARLAGPIPAGAAAIGSVTVTSLIPGVTGTALGKAVGATAGATDTGGAALAVRDDALTTLTPADGQYTYLRTDDTGALWITPASMFQAIGSVAHDSPDTQFPVKVGGYASAALRTAVTEADRVDASFDLQGRLRVAGALSSGGLGVTERATSGTTTVAQVTVDDSTVNGVALIAANATGTRRRVVVTNHSTTVVYINTGNLTAGGTSVGEALAGVVGAEKSFFTANALRATVDTGAAIVAVREEVLA